MCSNEWELIRHMRKEHDDTLKKYCSCDTCGTYFGIRHLLEVHNNKEYNLNILVEDSSAAESESGEHECQ